MEPLIASEWFHCKVFIEHFDIVSMVDKSKDHENMDSLKRPFLLEFLGKSRKRKTSCATITSFLWSDSEGGGGGGRGWSDYHGS